MMNFARGLRHEAQPSKKVVLRYCIIKPITRNNYIVNVLAVFLFLFLSFSIGWAIESSPTDLAIYYGDKNLPQLKLFNNVIVDSKNGMDPKQFDTRYRKAFVYVSVGEVSSLNFYRKPIDNHLIIGKNSAWNTLITDQANPKWQQFFLDNIVTPLWDRGFRGFYLDTLDSYRLVVHNPELIKKQQAGTIAIINAIKKKYPDAKLILNRGFAILPVVYPVISSITVESVFSGWNNRQKKYFKVNLQERLSVLREIDAVKKMGIPVTIVDYVPPNHLQEAQQIARQIADVGCNAWISNGQLTEMYLANTPSFPRKILIFYRGKLGNVDERIGSTAIKILSMPLNYLGYAVEVRNIEAPLPKTLSKSEYAGIVISIEGILLGREQELYDWYQKQLREKIPLVILYDFGFMMSSDRLKPFGLTLPLLTHTPHELHIIYQSPIIGYEIQPDIKTHGFIPVQLNANTGKSLFKLRDEVGLDADVAAITSWGGYYLGAGFLPGVISGDFRWAINPFLFFKEALKLPDLPIPDTTTENGMRLMFTQVDGDGFSNKAEGFNAPYVGEILSHDFLQHYSLPTTVSVIQGEIAANGLHPDLSKELEELAKKIFALPNVEIASHTFGHPFNWHDAAGYKGKGVNPYALPIPHYHFNIETEVVGSVNYINSRLAPADKKCKVFLWSGEGDVPEKALKMAYELGLRNLNPGTIITKYNPSKTRISALGLDEGPYFQIFAPIGNDQEVQGRKGEWYFYALVNLINALKLTDEPLRLKPIDIYIHFFTMAQPGGVKALKLVYAWVLKQDIMPIYGSEYVDKVIDFNQLIIAKKGEGWLIATNDNLREVRIPHSMGYPDLSRSHNIVGYSSYNDHYYVHLGPGGDAQLFLSKTPSKLPYLVAANARIIQYTKDNTRIKLMFKGYIPIKFTLANAEHCTVSSEQQQIMPFAERDHEQQFVLQNQFTSEVSIVCH